MEPQGAQEHVIAIVLGPQKLLKSPMDPFSQKSKPPNLHPKTDQQMIPKTSKLPEANPNHGGMSEALE